LKERLSFLHHTREFLSGLRNLLRVSLFYLVPASGLNVAEQISLDLMLVVKNVEKSVSQLLGRAFARKTVVAGCELLLRYEKIIEHLALAYHLSALSRVGHGAASLLQKGQQRIVMLLVLFRNVREIRFDLRVVAKAGHSAVLLHEGLLMVELVLQRAELLCRKICHNITPN